MTDNNKPNNPSGNNNHRPKKFSGGNNNNNNKIKPSKQMTTSRDQAVRAMKRSQADASRIANQFLQKTVEDKPRANFIDESPRLKIIPLGGNDGGGSKNMILVEYMNDAVIMDCGNDLGVDLPGINYAVCDTTYLETIKHKIKAYIISHGHLDHIGGLPHIVPNYPAPIYGSKFTIGRVEEIFENFGLPMPDGFELRTVSMNEDTHERLKIGEFYLELVRVTHSIPGSTLIALDTPVGRIINTGDFKLDPTPLDHEKTDTDRLKEMGKQGVLLLMSESTTTERPGHTPTESLLEDSFKQILSNAPGRVMVGLFSTNMNRVQMIVNAAVHSGKKVAMDGRSMVSTLEMAVRHGFMKIPKGTFVPIASANTLKDEELVVVCTGSQGEPSSALQRMSTGEHRFVKLKEQDTVVLASSPIPYTGNDASVRTMVDKLLKMGVHVYRHETHEIDNIGPLHVSGHGSRDDYAEMIEMLQPKYFLPIYGDFTAKKYHIDLAIEHGIPRANTMNIENGQVIGLLPDKMELIGEVTSGTILVDQTGAIVNNVVIRDRIMLSEDGLVAVVLTIDKKNGNLLTSPDIISRGFIYMRDNEEIMNGLRQELKRAVGQRYRRVDLDRFKAELKDHITHYLFEHTQKSPIIIPVINVINGGGQGSSNKQGNGNNNNAQNSKPTIQEQEIVKSPEQLAEDQQKRFEEMRAKLLTQDARVD